MPRQSGAGRGFALARPSKTTFHAFCLCPDSRPERLDQQPVLDLDRIWISPPLARWLERSWPSNRRTTTEAVPGAPAGTSRWLSLASRLAADALPARHIAILTPIAALLMPFTADRLGESRVAKLCVKGETLTKTAKHTVLASNELI